MTSNLGAREMSEMISGGIGFAPTKSGKSPDDNEIDTKIYRTAWKRRNVNSRRNL
jgi:hypothetical protein